MTDTPLETAVARLERAIGRVERAAAAPRNAPALPDPAPIPDAAMERLERRHATLRARVQETIERLDGLIDAGGDAG